MKLRSIIVEDEPLAAERLLAYARQSGHLEVVAVVDNAEAALELLRSQPIDLMLLDIHLGGMSGIELLELAKPSCAVILTTAYPEYALRSYELRVTDYLLKPFGYERFEQAVSRAREQMAPAQQERNHFFVKSGTQLLKVDFEEILFIEGMRDYRRIHTASRRIMTLLTFTELEQQLPAHLFQRIHKSWMVALGKIEVYEKDEVSVSGKRLPVSETYRASLKAAISPK